MTPENKVKARVRVLLKELGAYSLSVTTNGMGESGHPDRVACLNGRFLGIECKATSKQKPTPLQARRLADCAAAGGYAFVVDIDNIDRFAEVLADLGGGAHQNTLDEQFPTPYWR